MTHVIRFRVTGVARRSSSEVNTVHFTYNEKDEAQPERKIGAEWEEVEFTTVEDEKPVIQVANIQGNVYLPNAPIKLLINNPDLFGIYKVGDVIDFMPVDPNNEKTNPTGTPVVVNKAN
jgi:hypothetical protein